jgi:predicted lipoprotein with Yx(FWY)xxD motif
VSTTAPQIGSRTPWPGVLAVLGLAVLMLVGCASSTASYDAALPPSPALAPAPGPTVLGVRELTGLGPVLTTGAGFAVYVFPPDERRIVSCVDACAGSWPPITLAPGSTLVLGPGVAPGLVGQIPNPADPAGPQVLTYDGWPLYTYAADVDPGQATGQGLDLNGGPWYVIGPSGRVVVPPDQLAELTMSGMSGR